MTVLPLPVPAQPPGRWTWESDRGQTRAVRVSAHPELGRVVLSLWRDDRCVGSVHLTPAEAAALTGKVAEALAGLPTAAAVDDAVDPAVLTDRVARLEERLALLEQQPGA
jgi:hypothetical protein